MSEPMERFFRSLDPNNTVKQAMYEPLGSIFGGPMQESEHTDHQHVATYDKGGGWLLPDKTTLAYSKRRWHKRLLLWLYRHLPG